MLHTNLWWRSPIIFIAALAGILMCSPGITQRWLFHFLLLYLAVPAIFLSIVYYSPFRYRIMFFFPLCSVAALFVTGKLRLIERHVWWRVMIFAFCIGYSLCWVFARSLLNEHWSYLIYQNCGLVALVLGLFFIRPLLGVLKAMQQRKYLLPLLGVFVLLQMIQLVPKLQNPEYNVREMGRYLEGVMLPDEQMGGWYAPMVSLFSTKKVLTSFGAFPPLDKYPKVRWLLLPIYGIPPRTLSGKTITLQKSFRLRALKRTLGVYRVTG